MKNRLKRLIERTKKVTGPIGIAIASVLAALGGGTDKPPSTPATSVVHPNRSASELDKVKMVISQERIAASDPIKYLIEKGEALVKQVRDHADTIRKLLTAEHWELLRKLAEQWKDLFDELKDERKRRKDRNKLIEDSTNTIAQITLVLPPQYGGWHGPKIVTRNLHADIPIQRGQVPWFMRKPRDDPNA